VNVNKLALWLAAIATAADFALAQAPNTAIPAPPPAAATEAKPQATPATTPAAPAVTPPAVPAPRPATNRVAVPSQFRRTTTPTNAAPSSTSVTPRPAPGGVPAFRPGAGVPGANPAQRPGVPGAPGAAPVSTADQEANDAAVEAAKLARDSGDLSSLIEAAKFRNMPLEQMLDAFYAPLTGRTILRGQGLNLQTAITYLPTKPLSVEETIQAMDTVMALNQITTIPTGENFILVVPSQQAMQMGAKFSSGGATNYAEASQFVTHVVQVKHIDPKEAVELAKAFASAQGANGTVALESTKTIILRDFAINVKRMIEVIEKVDVEVEDEFILEVIPIRYGKVEDIHQSLTSVISGTSGGGGGGVGSLGTGLGNQGGFNQGGFNNNRRNTGMNRSGMNNGGFGGGGGFNNRNAGGFFQNDANRPVRTEDEAIDELREFFPNQVAAPVRVTSPTTSGSGQTFAGRLNNAGRGGQGQGGLGTLGELNQNASITPDLRSNSLIVYARKKDIAKIKEVVSKVDTLLAQVLIEAIIMEVSLNDTLNYGVTAGQRPKQFNGNPNVTGGGTMNNSGNTLGAGQAFLGGLASSATNFPSSSGLTYFMQLGQNWDLAANALATDSRVNVVQRPRVLTSHATPGSFQVGSEVPFVTGTFVGGGFGNSTQIQRQFVGVALDVIPFITPDSLVVMEINQTIDQLGPSVRIDGNEVPSTQTRSASSTVTVRNKEAIVLGGYITSNTSRSRSGVPVLSSIPILGNLFSSRSRNGGRTELMVLMRPTVLPTPTDAANLADEERARLPGVRVAEQEFEQTEREENRKADKQNAAARKREQRAQEKR
jgi:type II secretory pathway component GspD/PulD (secretin)